MRRITKKEEQKKVIFKQDSITPEVDNGPSIHPKLLEGPAPEFSPTPENKRLISDQRKINAILKGVGRRDMQTYVRIFNIVIEKVDKKVSNIDQTRVKLTKAVVKLLEDRIETKKSAYDEVQKKLQL